MGIRIWGSDKSLYAHTVYASIQLSDYCIDHSPARIPSHCFCSRLTGTGTSLSFTLSVRFPERATNALGRYVEVYIVQCRGFLG